ncbi:MAG: hypothetical protein Q7R41_13100 [Phycisphaerales bacterium]|nr:hypothetical protein [Phycisphaerales bacterium]
MRSFVASGTENRRDEGECTMIPVITGTVGESCKEFVATIRAVVPTTT